MCNENESLWVCFNGEIYNHADIRAELERQGTHQWKTDHSDTEVILHAFEQWGINCLERFRGMFAMALWDVKAKELWLIRDRIGIKPIYYSIHHGRITFASEIKALLEDPEQERSVNEEAFYHYLSFLTTPPPQTLFDGIKKLSGGTWLRVREDGQILENRYWDVWDQTTPLEDVSEGEIAEQILGELRTSVRLRKVSDVPVGVFLSGGIDSSTNAILFSEGEQKPIKTFSIGYKGEYESYPNELDYARKMADAVGAQHHEKLLDLQDLVQFLPRMVWLQDEPIADEVCVPIYYVSQLARENDVKVCQVGEGPDELFMGYAHWKQQLMLQRVNDYFPWPWPKKLAFSFFKMHPRLHDTEHLEWLRRAGSNQPIFWGGSEAFSELEKKGILHPRLRKRFAGYSSYEAIRPIRERFEQKCWEKSPLNWMSYLDLNLRLPELLLMRVDKMSMGVSLEARVPFLDHVFVGLAMSIPEKIKAKNGTLKYILKRAVRGLIPDEIIDRKKQGFGVPVYEWLHDELGRRAREELRDFCRKTDYIDQEKALQLIDKGRANQTWYLLNLALWWKEFIA
jgi:asparagine synthase (glutamine-hydrolysing)